MSKLIPKIPVMIPRKDIALAYYLTYVEQDLAEIKLIQEQPDHFHIEILDIVSDPRAVYGEWTCSKEWLTEEK